ncbi:hypothetical protein BARVI_11645 [Barnesiella viscericola DSM 18177]|uniref:Uncharacterized protein n=1 Tax=Barnesiella viscericola DSM 18177 TaxID=880074 RepID=W0EWK9_9BACT|nr:hypothetical protein BARVI_11645 [Barnesiella viscericola DSM 18177]
MFKNLEGKGKRVYLCNTFAAGKGSTRPREGGEIKFIDKTEKKQV